MAFFYICEKNKMTKEEIRKEYSLKRKNLSITEYEELNEDLSNHLRKFFQEKGPSLKIASFFPISSNKEVNTIIFHDWLRQEPMNHEIYLPKTNGDNLEFYLFEENESLIKSELGIMEPNPNLSDPLSPKEIDLILVPLIAVDVNGHRVGYGKGYYDRFLKRLNSHTEIIGLSLELPIEPISDINQYDFPLQIVISPHGAHIFN